MKGGQGTGGYRSSEQQHPQVIVPVAKENDLRSPASEGPLWEAAEDDPTLAGMRTPPFCLDWARTPGVSLCGATSLPFRVAEEIAHAIQKRTSVPCTTSTPEVLPKSRRVATTMLCDSIELEGSAADRERRKTVSAIRVWSSTALLRRALHCKCLVWLVSGRNSLFSLVSALWVPLVFSRKDAGEAGLRRSQTGSHFSTKRTLLMDVGTPPSGT